MRKKLCKTISSYANLIIHSYHSITTANALEPSLKLVAIEHVKKTDKIQFRLQITGKNIFPIISLEDLKNLKISSNFSKADQEIIGKFLSAIHKTDQRIIAKTYDREKKEFIYTVEFIDKDSNIKKCVNIDKFSLLKINPEKTVS